MYRQKWYTYLGTEYSLINIFVHLQSKHEFKDFHNCFKNYFEMNYIKASPASALWNSFVCSALFVTFDLQEEQRLQNSVMQWAMVYFFRTNNDSIVVGDFKVATT